MSEFLQQLINGLALGAIYALIALGYTMVYGVLRFINFAHGDVFMLGAFAGYYLSPVVNRFLPPQSYVGGAMVLVLAMAICARHRNFDRMAAPIARCARAPSYGVDHGHRRVAVDRIHLPASAPCLARRRAVFPN